VAISTPLSARARSGVAALSITRSSAPNSRVRGLRRKDIPVAFARKGCGKQQLHEIPPVEADLPQVRSRPKSLLRRKFRVAIHFAIGIGRSACAFRDFEIEQASGSRL